MKNLSLRTPWKVDQPQPHPDYPRPQLRRSDSSWRNLNGYWDYRIFKKEGEALLKSGQILVPFPPESALSGVEHILQPDEFMRYATEFHYQLDEGKRLLIHFGAVDQICRLELNGKAVGENFDGYLPFTYDITDFLQADPSLPNTLRVEVTDPTDTSMAQRGKQVLDPKNIWYTPVSGIWQTVWLEEVPELFIRSLKLVPDIDQSCLFADTFLHGSGELAGLEIEYNVQFKGASLVKVIGSVGETLKIQIPEPHLWSPDAPNLYDLTIRLKRGETFIDEVDSYFAMRKFGKKRDKDGYRRFTLNDEILFLYGPLDQGYWPEGLYTAPSLEALRYDLEYTKAIGCNMVRKHIKVEPLTWYRACDELGLIVWQDMPNGGHKCEDWLSVFTIFTGFHKNDKVRLKRFGREDKKNREQFTTELQRMIDLLYNVPSIAVWVPFNESWGQFESLRIADLVKAQDPTRLVDHASGWFDQGGGDFQSRHVYFKKLSASQPDHRILAVTEFGGYSLMVPGHTWDESVKFGYRFLDSSEALTKSYLDLLDKEVKPLISKGLAAAIYTQTTDIEAEVNGYLSYDRQVEKMDYEAIRAKHLELIALGSVD